MHDLSWEAVTGQLISRPTPELALLRNHTFVGATNKSVVLEPNSTLPLPGITAGASNALDVTLSFDVAALGDRNFSEPLFGVGLDFGGGAGAGAGSTVGPGPDACILAQLNLSAPDPRTGIRLASSGDRRWKRQIQILPGETVEMRLLLDNVFKGTGGQSVRAHVSCVVCCVCGI